MASMVTIAPSIASRSSSLGMATISLALVRHLHLAQHEALAGGKRGDHMNGRLAALFVM
jgi:hypothetical protein